MISSTPKLTYKQIVSQLTPEEKKAFDEWLTIVTPAQGSRPDDTPQLGVTMICRYIPSIEVVHKMLEQYNLFQTMVHTSTPEQEGKFITTVATHIRESKLLAKYSTSIKADLGGCFLFLDPKNFFRLHCDIFAARNPGITRWYVQVLQAPRDLGTQAFEHEGVLYLRAGNQDQHFAIHEAIHTISIATKDKVGHCLNEALTEDIALRVCQERGIPFDEGYYPEERRLLDGLCSLYKLSDDKKIIITFENPQLLIDLIRQSIGDVYCERFLKAEDAAAASNVFNEGWSQKQSSASSKKQPPESSGCSLM